MYTILLNDDKSLIATEPQTIYQNENAADSIRFLLPETLDEFSISKSTIFVSYIRSDNRADVDRLDVLPELYNGYLECHLKMASRITQVPGKVCLFLQIYSGDPDRPTILKTGEHNLIVAAHNNMDHYIADIQLSALYRMQTNINQLKMDQSDLAAAQEEMREEIPDDLIIAERRLHLSKDENPMGEGIDLDKIDDPVLFDDSSNDDPDKPDDNQDDVILFDPSDDSSSVDTHDNEVITF